MTDKQQRPRELLAAAYGAVANGTMHDLETEVLLQGAGPAIEVLAAALPDEQPAQGEKVTDQQEADAVVTLFKRYQEHGDFMVQIAGVGIAVGPDAFLAPPAGPAVEVDYEVWQEDAFGNGDAMVAGSTSLKDAQHYAAVYSQDAPAWVVEVTRRALPPTTPTGERG